MRKCHKLKVSMVYEFACSNRSNQNNGSSKASPTLDTYLLTNDNYYYYHIDYTYNFNTYIFFFLGGGDFHFEAILIVSFFFFLTTKGTLLANIRNVRNGNRLLYFFFNNIFDLLST